MAVNQVYKVNVDVLNIRTEPSVTSKDIGNLIKGNSVTITELKKDARGNTWGKHSKGWSAIIYDKMTYMTHVSTTSQPATTKNTSTKTVSQSNVKTKDSTTKASDPATKTAPISGNTAVEFIDTLTPVYGAPHSFLENTDTQYSGAKYGRMYIERIVADAPILGIIPGNPRFLGKELTANKNSLIDEINRTINNIGEPAKKIVNPLDFAKGSRYYSHALDHTNYMKRVTILNRALSRFLNIHDRPAYGKSGTQWGTYVWENDRLAMAKDNFWKMIGKGQTIFFYYDKNGSSSSESYNNSTDRSMMEGIMNNTSNIVKEIEFLSGIKMENFVGGNKEAAKRELELTNMLASQNNGMFSGILGSLKNSFQVSIAGSNILFPELWRDSASVRNHTFNIHLVSPYGDPEAFFINIGVPLNFLLALVLPRQFGANGYYAPFIIRAFSKGSFTCDLGIVDSMTVSRFGSGDARSKNKFPLDIQVSFTIKQLYNAMSLPENQITQASNISMMDYLGSLAGLDMNMPDFHRRLDAILQTAKSTLTDIPGNIYNPILDSFTQFVRDVTRQR